MTTERSESQQTPSRSRRDDTIQALSTAFAQDELSVEELERRIDIAHRATAPAELDALLSDLKVSLPPVLATKAASAPAAPAARTPAPAPAEIRQHQTLVAIMGGVERKGSWLPARQNQLFAMMGGMQLDFREARMGPGITEITVVCCMGGVEIIVPPDMSVDAGGIAIMGGFAHSTPAPPAHPDAPVLRINGFVLMGGVEIQVRLPGETAGDTRKRTREERKRLKRGPS
ncbi:MAG: DUF1707 domain-containing protein [Gemmatimonadota bacterium]